MCNTDDLAERCRVFYQHRLQVAERFRAEEARLPPDDALSPGTGLDLAMKRLRREIAELMNEDNTLFKKLLALNDKIEDLKEQQETEDENGSRCGSLESLSDAEEGVTADQSASPTSTLSSSSSLTTHAYSRFLRPQQTSFILRRTSVPFQKEVSRPLKIVTKDISGRLLLVRTTKDSFLNNTTSPEMSAYDSGFHGSESDPENNEIFV